MNAAQRGHGFSYFHGYESPFPDFPAFTHINEAICTSDHVLHPHAHPHFEFCFFHAGHAEWSSGGERYRLNPGDFYISRPGELHSGLPDPLSPNHNFAVGFDPTQLALAVTENGSLTSIGAPSEVSAALIETCALSPVEAPRFQRIIPGGQGAEVTYRRIIAELDALDQSHATRRTLTKMMVQVLLVELLVTVTRLSIAQLDTRQGPTPLTRPPRPDIQAVLSWLPSQLAEPPSLTAMAARAGLSPTHFAVAFKREVGQTPLEYVTRLRIDEAARRLRAGARVTDAALDLGFSSSQYFSLVFKKQIGCTPSEWRSDT